MAEQKAKIRSEYSPAETKMIMCITRERNCTPDKCLKCGWLRDDVREKLIKAQSHYEAVKP